MATASIHTSPARVHPPPNIFVGVPGTRRPSVQAKIPHAPQEPIEPGPDDPRFVPEDKQDVALLLPIYGSASASTWLEKRYTIWRGQGSSLKHPLVQGYLDAGRYLFCWGPPMCKDQDKRPLVEEMIKWAKAHKKRLVWCCVDQSFESILADIGWSTLSCIQEDVLHPAHVKLDDHDVKQNVRRAQKESVNVEELRLWEPDYMPDERTKKAIDEGLQAWVQNRKGRQIASASLDAWLDASSRRYYLARTPGKIVGILILTPLAHESYQIKNCIAFPDSPKGTSEVLLTRVIQEMAAEGRESLSFGASAREELEPTHNLHGWKIKALTKGYHAITHRTQLVQRGQFRAKFDLEPEPLYVCYPQHKFGFTGLMALMKMLKA